MGHEQEELKWLVLAIEAAGCVARQRAVSARQQVAAGRPRLPTSRAAASCVVAALAADLLTGAV